MTLWLWLSCSQPEAPPEKSLVDASQQVHFASVEKLGAHHSLITVEVTERQFTRETSSSTEVLELWWESWSRFRYQRKVNGKIKQEVLVIDDRPWQFNGKAWRQGDDPESYRNQLKLSWDIWGRVYRSFSGNAKWTEEAVEMLGKRSVQRYSVTYTPPEKQPAYGLIPTSLSAIVWVDQATAVRLLGEMTAVRENEGYQQTQVLRLERDQIGENFEFIPPTEVQKNNGLMKLEKRPGNPAGN